jgi:hypothetical protein
LGDYHQLWDRRYKGQLSNRYYLRHCRIEHIQVSEERGIWGLNIGSQDKIVIAILASFVILKPCWTGAIKLSKNNLENDRKWWFDFKRNEE